MAKWFHTLDLYDIFHDDEKTFIERRDEIVRRIKAQSWYTTSDDMDLLDPVAGLEDSEDEEEFNDYWDELYNWADDARVWLNTLFAPAAKS